MKSLSLLIFLFVTTHSLFSQTFNTGEILKTGTASAGINPIIVSNALGVYLHGGYGIVKNVDLGFRYGIFEGSDYIGADVEWALRGSKRYNLSLITGAHTNSHFGLDLGLAFSFPINHYAKLFTGIDSDINFNLNNERFFWLPAGLEIFYKDRASFIIEVDIPVVDFAPGIFGGGLAFYFR